MLAARGPSLARAHAGRRSAHAQTVRAADAHAACARSHAINQHDLASELQHDASIAEYPFFKALELAEGVVSVLDRKGVTFTRAWCGFELYRALLNPRGQAFKLDTYAVSAGTKEGNERGRGFEKESAIEVRGVRDGDSLEAVSKDFPLAVAERAADFSVESAQASVGADKLRILAFVGEDKEAFDATLRARFASVLLPHYDAQLARAQVDTKGGARKATLSARALKTIRALARSRARALELPRIRTQEVAEELVAALGAPTAVHLEKLTILGCDRPLPPVRLVSAEHSLTSLTLAHCGVSDSFVLAELGAGIAASTTLTALDLSCHKLGSAGLIALAEAIGACKTLSTARLCRGPLATLGRFKVAGPWYRAELGGSGGNSAIGDAFGRALRANEALTSLDLSGNWEDSGLERLAHALPDNPPLRELNLGGAIAHRDLPPLIEALLGATSALTTLNLSQSIAAWPSSGWQPGGPTISLGPRIMAALSANSSLSTLELADNCLGDEVAVQLAGALRSNSALSALELSSNLIMDAGVLALADWLRSREGGPRVQALGLILNNCIRPGTEEKLVDAARAAGVRTLCGLKAGARTASLSFGAGQRIPARQIQGRRPQLEQETSGLTSPEAVLVAFDICANPSLTSLDLSWNRFDSYAARVIAEALRKAPHVTALNLSNNRITDATAFVDLLRESGSSRSLSVLDLRGNLDEYASYVDFPEWSRAERTKRLKEMSDCKLALRKAWRRGAPGDLAKRMPGDPI